MLKALVAGLILLGATIAFLVPKRVEGAQSPDPQDSVIVESKTVAPVAGACASAGLRVKVWITNKDSLANIALVHTATSISGGAYAIISRSGSCTRPTLTSVGFDFLYPAGPGGGPRLTSRVGSYSPYHSNSPDTFLFAFTLANPSNDDEKMPPNLSRTLLGEIKFDTVLANSGTFEIDSGRILSNTISFVDLGGNGVKPNFRKGVITVNAPDPRDSVIVESKYYFPTAGPCQSARLRVKVWVTNKDSLANITLVFLENTLSGGAYATLSRSASCGGFRSVSHVFDFLYPPGPGGIQRLSSRVGGGGSGYNSVPRDSFLEAFTLSNPSEDAEKFPINSTRAQLGELKFDTVLSNLGQIVIDSSKILALTIQFVDLNGNAVFVNFVKSIITVIPKGDLNADGMLTSADMVLMLNCAFCAADSCIPLSGRDLCDMNCDGIATGSDVVLLLNLTFLGTPLPC